MKNLRVASCLLVLLVVNACASVQTTGRRSFDGDQNLARPTRIIVYDFAATADDVAASSAITGDTSVVRHPRPPMRSGWVEIWAIE